MTAQFNLENNLVGPKRFYRKNKQELQKTAMGCVRSFRNILEPEAQLHGSFLNGTYSYESDIDIVSQVSLTEIESRVSMLRRSQYQVVGTVGSRVRRLVLWDDYWGFIIDIVEEGQVGKAWRLRDQMIYGQVRYDPRVLECLQRIRKWRSQFPLLKAARNGLPNTFSLTIILLFVLAKNNVIPWLDNQCQLSLDEFLRNDDVTTGQIMKEFMNLLCGQGFGEIINLKQNNDIVAQEFYQWLIIDPVTGDILGSPQGQAAWVLAVCANHFLLCKSFNESNRRVEEINFEISIINSNWSVNNIVVNENQIEKFNKSESRKDSEETECSKSLNSNYDQ